jgi:hypothetical protein
MVVNVIQNVPEPQLTANDLLPATNPGHGAGPWIGAVIFVLLAVGSVAGILWSTGRGPFAPKPKDLIVGKWHGEEGNGEAYFTFHADGVMDVITGPKGKLPTSPERARYHFIDDNTIELTVPGESKSPRAEVRFPSKDQLIFRGADNLSFTLSRVK